MALRGGDLPRADEREALRVRVEAPSLDSIP